jgi:hypothetical protein
MAVKYFLVKKMKFEQMKKYKTILQAENLTAFNSTFEKKAAFHIQQTAPLPRQLSDRHKATSLLCITIGTTKYCLK